MSLFTKTVVVRGGMSHADAEAVSKGFTAIAMAVKERLEGQDKEIAELREEVAALKHEPRMSFAQKIKSRG